MEHTEENELKVISPGIHQRKKGNFGEELLSLYVFSVYWSLSPAWGVPVCSKVCSGVVVPAWLCKHQRPGQVK